MIRRLVIALLAVCILAGCRGRPQRPYEPADTPAPEPTVAAAGPSLRVMAARAPSQPDFSEMYAFQAYERRTGVRVEWIYLPANDLAAARTRAVASGDLPDAFYAAEWTPAEVARHGASGVFVPVDGLLPAYAPNADRLYRTSPEVRLAMVQPDGRIYGFPRMHHARHPAGALMLRRDWLDALNRNVPTTPADLLATMAAFQTAGYGGFGGSVGDLRAALMGAYGLGNRGQGGAPYFDADPGTGEPRFWPGTTAYRDLLTLLADFYRNGIFGGESQPGLAVAPLTDETAPYYVGLGALAGPGGALLWANVVPQVEQAAAFIITRACRDVPMAVAWADGWLDNGRNANALYEDGGSPYASGLFLGLIMRPAVPAARSDAQAEAALRRQMPPVTWPRFPLTAGEQAVADGEGARIAAHVESFTHSVVTGEVALNAAAWNAYRAELAELGLAALTEAYTAAFARYRENGGR
jgi:ABC-type glycerol-3-phosphate transport system substrate-binding protein